MNTQKKRPFKRIIIVAILLLIAAGIGASFLRKSDSPQAANITYAKPEIGSIEESVTAQGKLEPKEYVDVGTQVSGKVDTLYFDVGATIKKDDLLAELDPQLYESKVEADRAKVATLNAQLQQQMAQIELANQLNNRNVNLIKSDAISKQALDESKSALKVAQAGGAAIKAQLREAESTLKGDEANLSYTKIYAPMDGTITSISVKVGQTLNANQTTPTVLQVSNLDVMTVRAQVAEADVMKLKEGSSLYFTVLGTSERQWHGTLRQVLPAPETVNDVVLYIALIDIDNKDRQLMTGMSTQIFFVIGKADNALLIPSNALGARMASDDKEGSKAYSVTLKNGEKKTVLIGLLNRGKAQVISGLDANDELQIASREKTTAAKKPTMRGGPRL